MAQPPHPPGFPSWRAAHQHRMNVNNDADLAEAIRQSTVNYKQEQIARYQQGIEIAVQILPMSAAPDSIATQYADMLHITYAGSDYILLPRRFANTIYPDVDTHQFNTGLTVFRAQCGYTSSSNTAILQGDQNDSRQFQHHVQPNTVFLTMHGFINGPEQEYAYVDNIMFKHLGVEYGQLLHLTIVPANQILSGTHVVLTPLQPLQFLAIKNQAHLVEGHLGKEYRILYPGQHISVYSQENGMEMLDMVVEELYANHSTDPEQSNIAIHDGQPAIITDTTLEVEFRVCDEDRAAFTALHRPPIPHTYASKATRFRIRGILPAHLEEKIDEIVSRHSSSTDNTGREMTQNVVDTQWSTTGFKLKHKIAT